MAIVGGVVGGVSGLTVVAAVTCWFIARRWRASAGVGDVLEDSHVPAQIPDKHTFLPEAPDQQLFGAA